MLKLLKHLSCFTIFFAIIFFSISSIANDKDHLSNEKKYSPIISKKVKQKAEAGEKVAVLIKLKEEWEHPSVKMMTTSDDPAHFISKQNIKRLQKELEASFTRAELQQDIKIIHKLGSIAWITGEINWNALEKLKAHSNVAMIIEDTRDKLHLVESGPLINANLSHLSGYTGYGVTVAVIDTGIDTDHPDLQGDLVREECFLLEGGCPVTGLNRASGPGSAEDGDGHGTHVSGIITSANSTYTGIAPDTKIVSLKTLDDNGTGWSSDRIAALDWIIINKDTYGIDVVNMSLGSTQFYPGTCDDSAAASAAAADAAKAAGIVLFASSGNDGATNGMNEPACLSSVISVGSVYDADVHLMNWGTCKDNQTEADKISCFSNVSTELDLLAPGSIISSTALGGGIINLSGTSMASPHAAAVAALMLQKNSYLKPDYIKNIIIDSGVLLYDARVDSYFPRIDSEEALNLTVGMDDTVTDNDNDGIPDSYELSHGLNPFNSNDASEDPDGDGLSNLDEYYLGSDPHDIDTDDDEVADGFDGYPLDDQVSSCIYPVLNARYQEGFSSIQEAINDTNAADYDMIQITAADFPENILFNQNIMLTLSGGYYCSYLGNPSTSSINSLTIKSGTVRVKNIIIQSQP